MKKIFKIKVTNWNAHNPNPKKSYKKTLICNGIVGNAKLQSLPVACRWLFLALVLQCGNDGYDTVTISERNMNAILSTRIGASKALCLLEQYQLVTYQVFIKGIELKRKEEKIISKERTKSKPPPSAPVGKPPDSANSLIALYCELWKRRYDSPRSPDIGGASSKQFKILLRDFGENRAKALIEAYLQMPDSWFVTKRHDVFTLRANLNAVGLFADSGKMISRREANQLDLAVSVENTLEALRRGEL